MPALFLARRRRGTDLSEKFVSSHLLQRFVVEDEDFFQSLVAGDESWYHQFDTETDQQIMGWHDTILSKKRKPTMLSARKTMATVGRDAEG